MDVFRQLWTGLVDIWQKLSTSARINIAVSVALVFALVLGAVVLGGKQELIPIFRGLDAADADAMQQIMADQGIKYELTDSYSTLSVPARSVGQARHAIGLAKLPRSQMATPLTDALEKESLFISPEKHRENVRFAVQAELVRQINQYDFVDQSYVYIDQPEEDLLSERQQPAKAAVTLDVNRVPSKEEIEILLGLTASFGGARLDRNHITMATTDGLALHTPSDDPYARVASTMHDVVAQWERQREQKIMEAFRGMGTKAIVKVSAKLDTRKQEIVDNTVKEGTEFSVAETEQELTTVESLPEGQAGAMANMPDGAVGPNGTNTTETSTETVSNFEPSRTTTKTSKEPGEPAAYKICAIIDWSYKPVPDANGAPTDEKEYGPPTEQELEQYRQFVAYTVGPDVDIEKDVYVFSQPFQLDQVEGARAALAGVGPIAWISRNWQDSGWWVLKVGMVLALFIFTRRLLLRMFPAPIEEEEEVMRGTAPSPEEMRKREIAQEVEQLSQNQPDAVAALLRAWMSEGEE